MSANGMQQIEEKHVATKVEMMVWCNRMDLLALSNFRGEVQVHRLNWQRVWILSPPMETCTVKGMIWRPDGKVIAIGYSCGTVYLVDVEDKEILHITKSRDCGSITYLSWALKVNSPNSQSVYSNYDDTSIFLPKPPILNPSYKNGEDIAPEIKHSIDQTQFNILITGYENGELHLSVFGLFPCGVIDMKKIINQPDTNIEIVDAQLSDDFATMQVFVKSSMDNQLKLALLDTETLAAYSDELHALATKHGQMARLLTYIDQTMTSIIEAWEQILLEMDSKLEKYARHVPEGGISADFLDLLMLGVPSDELELFLLRDLTAKGLKKFGTSVELSYSTIQKLLLKQLNTVGHDITYHLAELRGLARIVHRYQILGLDEEAVTQAILSSSAFINKCLELQQVIDHAMKNYKAFFRWLYTVIVRLMDEHVPSEIVKVTQQDLTYIAEFLLNFGNEDSRESHSSDRTDEKKGRFNLEKLGQYLADKELTMTHEDENPWLKFLSENPCIANHPSIIKSFKKFSLVQQQNHLKEAITNVFTCSEKSLGTQFTLLHKINCMPCDFSESLITSNLRVTQIYLMEEQCILTAFTDVNSIERGFYFLEISLKNDKISVKCGYFYFYACPNLIESKLDALEGNQLRVVDLQFYSTDMLSVLLDQPNDDSVSSFVQFPLKLVRPNSKEMDLNNRKLQVKDMKEAIKMNAFGILEAGACKVLDKISAYRLAVSGGRKVAVVLSKACRKVRLFEMEVDGEDDDDETLDTTPQSHCTTQHSDTSQNMNDSMPINMCIRNNDEAQSESIDLDTSENF